jgi:hypothetical protein
LLSSLGNFLPTVWIPSEFILALMFLNLPSR